MDVNRVMIITHDTGRHLGCYGAGVKTPHLDCLAETGVRFNNYFCTAPQCSPSRGSIVTGKYPHRNGLVGLAHLGWEINPGERTLPMCLNDAGYDTYLFGVQHENEHPQTLGYQHIFKCAGAGHSDEFGHFISLASDATEEFMQQAEGLAHLQKPFYASIGIRSAPISSWS